MCKTKQYIETHIKNVRKKIQTFSSILYKRGELHDRSKLEYPEYQEWCKMDEEPKYPYGSKEYERKKQKYKYLFDYHYAHNRHHPDRWKDYIFPFCPDLLDLIEMLCDWIAYKDSISYKEAKEIIKQQSIRFKFSEELSDILLNTLYNYYVCIGKANELKNEAPKIVKNYHHVDILT